MAASGAGDSRSQATVDTTLGGTQHKNHLGTRDAVDLDALATSANQLSLSTPPNKPRRNQPFVNDPVPPPDQPTTKAELEERVGQVKGYLTRMNDSTLDDLRSVLS